tara:strand:+ start:21 stop:560 length:540 start_codon:yes stop_codon:yes gene_type:complete
MKKNLLNKLINNKIVYYVVLAFSVLNVLGYFSMRAWECIVLFSAVAYSANCYGGNMTVALLAGLFVSNFVFGCNRVKEGFEEQYKPIKKANKLIKKAKKKALKEGNDVAKMLAEDPKEPFALREGNANIMKLAQEMMSTLDKKGGKEGVDMEGAEGIEKMLEGLGGVKGIMKALGNMKT